MDFLNDLKLEIDLMRKTLKKFRSLPERGNPLAVTESGYLVGHAAKFLLSVPDDAKAYSAALSEARGEIDSFMAKNWSREEIMRAEKANEIGC